MRSPERKTILLVEDEALISLVGAKTIKQFGYKVITANTGEKAVRRAVENINISLILMDINLGKGIDGPEAARQILSKKTLPIVFITSHTEKEYVDRVKEITRYGYVIKNSGDLVLQSAIEMALELFEAHRSMERTNQELTETNRKLYEKEEEYHLLFENTLSGVFIAQDDKLAIVNPAAALIMGYPVKELTEKPFYNFIYPDDISMFVDHYARKLKGETLETNYPFRIVTAKGIIKWVDITSALTSWNSRAATLNYIIDITERKKAEEARHKSEKIYRLITDNSVDMISRHAANGTILYVTPSCEKLTGYKADELIGKPAEFLLLSEDYERVWNVIRSRQEGENWYRVENRLPMKDGSIIWVETMGRFIRDESGLVREIQCNVRDITERKQMEESLKLSRERLEDVQRTAKIGNWEANLATGELYWSQAIFDIFGYDSKSFKPSVEAFYEAVHPDDRDIVFESETRSEQTGLHDVVHRIINTNGEVRFVRELAKRYHDDKGKLITLRGTVQDITEKKLADEVLQKSEERFRAIADYTYDWDNWIDPNGKLIWVNPGVERLTGYSVEECHSMSDFPTPIFDESDRERMTRIFTEVAQGASYNNVEFCIRCKDGSTKRGGGIMPTHL